MPTLKLDLSLAKAEWTEEKAARMRAEPESWPMIWILCDREDARLLINGDVPEEIACQCERALCALPIPPRTS